MTTAVYIVFDAFHLKKASTSPQYKAWAVKFAFGFFTLGMIWFAVMGSWYIFGTLDKFTLNHVTGDPMIMVIFLLTAISPGAPWVALLLMRVRISSNILPSSKGACWSRRSLNLSL